MLIVAYDEEEKKGGVRAIFGIPSIPSIPSIPFG